MREQSLNRNIISLLKINLQCSTPLAELVAELAMHLPLQRRPMASVTPRPQGCYLFRTYRALI
jgi:hypothetical protein